ncbi:ComEC/Rec2 family competence protein [Bacillus horti]|uniref:Beta-lactamase superfamily II metal-dependent hydrolase n=1 Tax=Caldalkalibacillus horti TaxID=77523 RepID=A0ABT9W375_9BACI|nr:ComEC/Rec2 family competence protein [Bacillus horti]MDQ0167524.1 beta-lactamase superfamily II metal-dependent hydrolase [Bacillus horti]
MELQDISALLLFIATLGWAIGLVNPKAILKWGKKPTRKKLTVYYIVIVALSIGFGQFADKSELGQRLEAWLVAGLTEQNETSVVHRPIPDGELMVHYIDVGQGDATLLVSSEATMLIDTGRHDGQETINYLREQGIKEIDLVVGTHAHADHIGQLAAIMNGFDVREVWMSGEPHTSKTFEDALDAIARSSADYYEPRAGEEFQVGDLTITVVSPKELIGDLNESSISMRIDYGEVSFLFTGDAEEGMEEEMLRSGLPLQADIFHLGHHGSSTSNTEEFLQRVNPKIAIYSAGKDNSYGHPHNEVIDRLEQLNIEYYGTDFSGTIIINTDGQTYTLETEN